MMEISKKCVMHMDDREKLPLKMTRTYYRPIKRMRLDVGDYRCECGKVGFERKQRDFENFSTVLRQCEELKAKYEHAYLIVNRSCKEFLLNRTTNYGQKIGFLSSLIVRGVAPLFVERHYDSIEIMYRVMDKHHDGQSRGLQNFSTIRHVNKKDQRLNILTSLPGIGMERAKDILSNFSNMREFFNADAKRLCEIPGIGKKTAEKIIDLMTT